MGHQPVGNDVQEGTQQRTIIWTRIEIDIVWFFFSKLQMDYIWNCTFNPVLLLPLDDQIVSEFKVEGCKTVQYKSSFFLSAEVVLGIHRFVTDIF